MIISFYIILFWSSIAWLFCTVSRIWSLLLFCFKIFHFRWNENMNNNNYNICICFAVFCFKTFRFILNETVMIIIMIYIYICIGEPSHGCLNLINNTIFAFVFLESMSFSQKWNNNDNKSFYFASKYFASDEMK